MSDPTDPLAWVDRAEEDYLLARFALRRKKPLTYGACFHAQQCAEKYLKAILIDLRTLENFFELFFTPVYTGANEQNPPVYRGANIRFRLFQSSQYRQRTSVSQNPRLADP